MNKYPIQNVSDRRLDVVQGLVRSFFADDAITLEVPLLDGGGYVIHSRQLISEGQRQKLEQLCRLKAREMGPAPTTIPGPVVGKGKGKASTNPTPVTAPPKKDKPDTLRVKNIPNIFTEDQVRDAVVKLFQAHAEIQSLVASNATHKCATITFPYERDYDFPLKKLDSFIQDGTITATEETPFVYDTKFEGLTPLYDAGQEQTIVDIIAVVGLGAQPFATFRSPKPKSTDMWLRDYLPRDVGRIRTVLYGYPSRVDASHSVETIEQFAETLLDRLTHFRRQTKTQYRPIVFLGQSLGGLVVQECLVIASHSTDFERTLIFESWQGFVGFGTPIAGLNNPSLLAAVQDQPNKILMQQICINENGEPSEYLKNLRVRFETCRQVRVELGNLHILYFWEALESRPRLRAGIENKHMLMVPKDNETPGAQNLTLHSDHSGMVKYESRTDPKYEDVKNNLDRIIQAIAASSSQSPKALGIQSSATFPKSKINNEKTPKADRKGKGKEKQAMGYCGDGGE